MSEEEEDFALLQQDEEKQKNRDVKDIKSKMNIKIDWNVSTYIIAISIYKNFKQNHLMKIPCRRGIPIVTAAYDINLDCYHLECADFISIGVIDISYSLTIKGVFESFMRVPLPESVIRRYLSSQQKKSLDKWKSIYDKQTFKIEYLQLIDAF